jgi:hypothetical protein
MAAIPAGARQEDLGALRLLIGASAGFVMLTAALYAWMISWGGPFPRDGSNLVVGRDFLNFWMYRRAAWTPDPSRFYDPLLYRDALAALLGAGHPGQNWSYPPSVMLAAALFGRLPISRRSSAGPRWGSLSFFGSCADTLATADCSPRSRFRRQPFSA